MTKLEFIGSMGANIVLIDFYASQSSGSFFYLYLWNR